MNYKLGKRKVALLITAALMFGTGTINVTAADAQAAAAQAAADAQAAAEAQAGAEALSLIHIWILEAQRRVHRNRSPLPVQETVPAVKRRKRQLSLHS